MKITDALKLVAILSALAIAPTGCLHGPPPPPVVVSPTGIGPNSSTRYLPDAFQNLYLGMALSAFETARPDPHRQKDVTMSFRIEVEEHPESGSIREVSWYFDQDLPGQPLYEGIFEFDPGYDLLGYIRDRYGSPNSEGEWEFDSGAGFIVRVWTFDQKLVVAAVMKGTEWME
jgi:hypothetical protein